MILEACVDTVQEGIEAFKKGATRIEFCADLSQDGLTPDVKETELLLSKIDIPIRVMIRNRGGNFCYSDSDINSMVDQIKGFKNSPIEGYVFGSLLPNGIVDMESCRKLMEYVDSKPVTFHKAIDQSKDILVALEQIKSIQGIDTILTSGGKKTALEGSKTLAEMVSKADHLEILVAGKVNQDNLDELKSLTGAKAFHGRKIMNSVKH